MHSFTSTLIAIAAAVSMVQAAPAAAATETRAVLTSCPANVPVNMGENKEAGSLWRNVCCAYTVDPNSCCLLDVSAPVVWASITESCDGYTYN